MKICFLSSMHPPLDKRVFDKEARTLADAGYEIVHVAPGDIGPSNVHGVELVTYPVPNGILGRIRQLGRLYRLAKKQAADVYHCNEVDSWIIGVFLCGKRKVCIFDVHEHYPSTFSESRFPRWMQPAVATAIQRLYRMLARWTDYFVIAKHSLAADFKHCGDKVVLLRNYARRPVAAAARESVRPFDEFTVVHLGAIGKARGWPQILDALALLREEPIRLLIVGQFIDGTEGDFWERAAELALQEKIEFRHWLPFPQAFELLQRSSVGLIAFQPGITNHVFASPHKLFDYMASGLPVIAPEFAEEVREIMMQHEVGLLVDPSDAASLANSIREIRDDPKKAAQWGKNGCLAVRDYYNWDIEAKHLLQLYSTVAHKLSTE